MRIIAGSVLVSMVLAGGAFAQVSPTPESPTPVAPLTVPDAKREKAEKDLDRVVCKREYDMGSNIPRKICMTQRERLIMAERTAAELNRVDRGETVQQDKPGIN